MHLSFALVLSLLHLQSIFLSYWRALPSALDNLSCDAAPGAVLNLLLLAGGPGNINKPQETMDWLNEHHTRIVTHQKGTGRRPLHFLCYCRESSIIILLHFYSPCFHPHLLFSFPHFPSLFTYTPFTPKERYCYEWAYNGVWPKSLTLLVKLSEKWLF